MPAWSEVQTCINSLAALLSCILVVHSYKSPGKHDGVNYILTSEEVRAETLWSSCVYQENFRMLGTLV